MSRATDWDLPTKGFPRISGVCGFDTETRDPDIEVTGPGWAFPDGRGEIVGYAFAWGERGQRHKLYLPVAHRGGGNLGKAQVERFVRDTLGQSDLTVIMHNRLYDEGWLRRDPQIPVRGRVYDTATAAPLLDEYKFRYSLDTLSKEYLGRGKNEAPLDEAVAKHNAGLRAQATLQFPGKGFTRERNAWIRERKWDSKADLWQMHANIVAPYASVDAENTLDLWDVFKPLLEADDLWGVFSLETRLLPVLLEMRWRGIRVDVRKAEQTRDLLLRKEAQMQAEIKRLTGLHVDPMNAEHLAAMFDTLGIAYPLTPKTQKPSFKKEWLKDLDHPVGELVRNLRRYSKTRTTFIESYVLAKHCGERVYGEVVPLPSEEGGAVTGRFSMRNPNLENLPNPEKDFEMGVAVREIMLPEDGEDWAAIDFSQQEPRIMVDRAAAAKIKGAAAAVRAYCDNPKMDYHRFMADLCGLERYQTKPINLGVGYGMGGAKLCRALGLPTEWIWSNRQQRMVEIAGPEGQEILDKYHKNAPFVKGLSDECERRARNRGWVRTILGRKCRFVKGEGNDRHYKAMNRVVQGSAADQTKKAMVDMWDAGEVALVPVHDELGCSVRDRAHAEYIMEIMVNAVPLRVPVMADIEMGPSWGATVKEES